MEGLYRFELVYYLEVSLKERRYVFSSPRMRWADIEVPNLVVDVAIIFLIISYGLDYPIILFRMATYYPSFGLHPYSEESQGDNV